MTYVNLTDDLCDPGKFMDALAPDVRAKAQTVDATAKPKPTLTEAVAHMLAVLRILHDKGRLCPFDRALVEVALAKWEESK